MAKLPIAQGINNFIYNVMYEGRSINKLQNGLILLIFKI